MWLVRYLCLPRPRARTEILGVLIVSSLFLPCPETQVKRIQVRVCSARKPELSVFPSGFRGRFRIVIRSNRGCGSNSTSTRFAGQTAAKLSFPGCGVQFRGGDVHDRGHERRPDEAGPPRLEPDISVRNWADRHAIWPRTDDSPVSEAYGQSTGATLYEREASSCATCSTSRPSETTLFCRPCSGWSQGDRPHSPDSWVPRPQPRRCDDSPGA